MIRKPTLSRWENEDELDKLIEEWTINHTKSEAMKILQRAGVAAAAVLNSKDLLNDPQLKARDSFVASNYTTTPGKWLAGTSWKMNDKPGGIYWPYAPSEDEDNEYIYGELLGLSKDEISRLVGQKVIY